MMFVHILLFTIRVPEDEVKRYIQNFKPQITDMVWIVIFSISFVFFLQLCTERYFPNWDNFTYWAIDSKYIFETGSLYGRSLDLLEKFYLPFYPLQLSYVYFIYGEVVEQFSSLLTLLYGFIALFTLTGYIIDSKKDSIIKMILYFISFTGLLYYFLSLDTLVTQYADVFCGVLVMFYGIIIFANNPTKENILLRFFSVLVVAVSVYLTKLAYAPISLLMLLLYLIYDAGFFIGLIKKLPKEKLKLLFIPFFLLCVLFIFLAWKFGIIGNILAYKSVFKNTYIFSNERFLYLVRILNYLLQRIPELILSVFLLLGGIFFSPNGFQRKDLKKISLVFIMALVPIGFYFMIMKDLGNGSLLRYTSLVFFLFPFLFIDIFPRIVFPSKFAKLFVSIVFLSISFSMVYKIYLEYNFSWEYSPNTGKYSDSKLLETPSSVAGKINAELSEDSTVMFVAEIDEENLGNNSPPNLYTRYYLAERSVGSQYEISKDEWLDYMFSYDPDYVFVADYSGYWKPCNDYLESGRNYLIKMRNNPPTEEPNSCFFQSSDIIEIN
ncbi:MAG TPA: hypothetical protein VJY47_00900 [Candidatus Dojkabacteria bacterium]|nr:hypothetical protein [Candidatus Dojkabacteria bacterium]